MLGDVRRAHVPAGRLSVPALRRHGVSQRQMFEQRLLARAVRALRADRQESGQARRLNLGAIFMFVRFAFFSLTAPSSQLLCHRRARLGSRS